jgi:uncharacterized Zn finger protein
VVVVVARESVREKAGRYLLEGRVLVELADRSAVVARVRGEGGMYRTAWSSSSGAWECSCPHIGAADCSHVLALKRITAVDLVDDGAAA